MRLSCQQYYLRTPLPLRVAPRYSTLSLLHVRVRIRPPNPQAGFTSRASQNLLPLPHVACACGDDAVGCGFSLPASHLCGFLTGPRCRCQPLLDNANIISCCLSVVSAHAPLKPKRWDRAGSCTGEKRMRSPLLPYSRCGRDSTFCQTNTNG